MATFIQNVTDIFPEPSLFNPDFSFMDKMLQRRQALYEQGFAQVNSKYNLINRDVTNFKNREERDAFLKQAKESLKNLSSLDLSQPQNVELASSVFDPFSKKINILGDQALTSHWDSQESIAESFRLKDGGKDYSDDNINYVRQQRQAFAKDSPDAWRNYYADKKSFTPYYDYNKELKDAMDKFKPSHTKLERKNGMYMVTTDESSWTAGEISKYLDGILSDKAKTQMKIEASVRLASNPQALAGAFLNTASTQLTNLQSELAKYDDQIKKTKNQDKIKLLKEDRDYYQKQYDDLNANVKTIKSGDISALKKNAENIAYTLYYGQKVNGMADAYQHKDYSETIGFDQVAMMYYRDNEEWKRTYYKERKADERADKLLQGTTLPPIEISAPGEKVETSLISLKEDVTKANRNRAAATEDLKQYIFSTSDHNIYKSVNDITDTDVQNFVLNHPTDPKVQNHIQAGQNADAKKAMLESWHSGAEAYAKSQMGENYDRLQILKKDFYSKTSILGKENNKVFDPRFATDSRTPISGIRDRVLVEELKSKPEELRNLEQAYNQYVNQYNSKSNTIISKTQSGFILNPADKRFQLSKGYLSAITGQDPSKLGQISYFPSYNGYDIKFNFNDKNSKEPIDRESMTSFLTANFGNLSKGITVEYNKDLDQFTIKNIGYSIAPQLDPYSAIPPTHKEILASLENYAGTPGMERSGTMFTMKGKKEQYIGQINKVFGYSGNDYILSINGKKVIHPFKSSYQAYITLAEAINDSAALNYLINSND